MPQLAAHGGKAAGHGYAASSPFRKLWITQITDHSSDPVSPFPLPDVRADVLNLPIKKDLTKPQALHPAPRYGWSPRAALSSSLPTEKSQCPHPPELGGSKIPFFRSPLMPAAQVRPAIVGTTKAARAAKQTPLRRMSVGDTVPPRPATRGSLGEFSLLLTHWKSLSSVISPKPPLGQW